MRQLFQAIDVFLNRTTHEIVVVELTHIYNAEDEQQATLAQMMMDMLGHHIAPCCRCGPCSRKPVCELQYIYRALQISLVVVGSSLVDASRPCHAGWTVL